MYILTGLLGYLTFGSSGLASTTGNVVNAYRHNDVPVNIGRVGLFFHFCTAFPIVAIGCRNCLNGILFHSPDRSQATYIVESIILVSTSAVLAMVVPGIAFVVDIIGSLFGVAIVFIIPSVVYIQSNRRFPDDSQGAAGGVPANGEGEEGTTARFFKGISNRVFGSTNEEEKAAFATESSTNATTTTTPTGYQPPPSWLVRKNRVLYGLAIVYVFLGIAGAVISFAVTLDKVINGES